MTHRTLCAQPKKVAESKHLARVRELEGRLHRAEECIRDFAWHAAGYRHELSPAEVLAKVAEHFGISIVELNRQMAEAGK